MYLKIPTNVVAIYTLYIANVDLVKEEEVFFSRHAQTLPLFTTTTTTFPRHIETLRIDKRETVLLEILQF